MRVRIVGVELPGRTWGDPRPEGCVYDNIHVGVQRRTKVVDLVPADATEAIWDFAIDVSSTEGQVDFFGPHVQGRRGERFFYLSWGAVDEGGAFEMFRRAKLMLGDIDSETLAAAAEPGQRLVGTLGLTGSDGGPRCAAVRPPTIGWTAESAG